MSLVDTFRLALVDMVDQFAYRGLTDGARTISTGGLSALEHAFRALSYTDPQPCPESPGCAADGCNGWPVMTSGGKWWCREHDPLRKKA